MESTFEQNTAFAQAVSFVNHTDKSIFLTGKAGTGKTTFLRYIKNNCPKKMAIAAPTGVAAINAGGITLHSLFWLPFGTFLADYEMNWDELDNQFYNRRRLLSKLRFTKERKTLLQEMELLVIDEVSMLRADMLDAIDTILKSVRRDARPFGGVQTLFIGDLFQLPPVVKRDEWSLMQHYYKSPFFFDAQVLTEFEPVLLELTKVYRQSDDNFVDLLNSIRKNTCDDAQLDMLNSYYQPDFVPPKDKSFITLCSHNAQANQINQHHLNLLEGKTQKLNALVSGNFSESAYPADAILALKEGAQVMFIKNDKGEDRKYYNGKIGVVEEINEKDHKVIIAFQDGSENVAVEKEEWKNVKYSYDKEKDKINEETLGTFSQYPLRLAWAVTIHKSQGLTFERAVIDAGSSFAAGQVYVALSRLTSLGGLVLKTKINPGNIFTDAAVNAFSENTLQETHVHTLLEESQRDYLLNLLLNSFQYGKLLQNTMDLKEETLDKNIADKDEALLFLDGLAIACKEVDEVAQKFTKQLKKLIYIPESIDYAQISLRTSKASGWFKNEMGNKLVAPLENHIKAWGIKKRTKKYIVQLGALFIDYKRKLAQIEHCKLIAESLANGTQIGQLMEQVDKMNSIEIKMDDLPVQVSKKKAKGETQRISLGLYKEGKTIEEIAELRGLTLGTITGHLANFIGGGIEATDLIDKKQLDTVLSILTANPDKPSGEIKSLLGDNFTYTDISIGRKVLELEELK